MRKPRKSGKEFAIRCAGESVTRITESGGGYSYRYHAGNGIWHEAWFATHKDALHDASQRKLDIVRDMLGRPRVEFQGGSWHAYIGTRKDDL